MIAANDAVLGERAPSIREEPHDAASVAAILHSAAQADRAVVAFGGGTLQSLGNAPRAYDIALSLRRLDAVLSYDHRDLTIGVEAGATLAAVARTLGEFGQFIPFDAPHPARATIGGTLAAGWAGPRRTVYGRLRDLAIGSTVALTDGTLASAGGMVVKNVTGYDMSKLYIGSLGTLGIITRANFKALPRPPATRIAIAPLGDDARERALAAIAHLSIEPSAVLIVHGFFGATPRLHDEDVRMLVLFEGSAAVIERATRELRSALGAAGIAETLLLEGPAAERTLQSTIDAYVESLADRTLTYRSTGLASNAWARADALADIVHARKHTCDRIVDIRTGDAIVRVAGRSHAALLEDLAGLDAEVRRIVPNACVLAGDARLRAAIDAWGAVPSTLETMRAIKLRFDPTGTLAPGRYVGGL